MNPVPHLVLFDAYNSLYRAYHAIQMDMRTSSGESVAAVYGFTRSILKTLREMKPTHFVVCWDSKPKERLELDPEYKAHRPPTPEDLKAQIVLAREFLQAWGLPSLEMEGLEADDLMAALARQADEKGWRVTLITTDKDMLQTATESTGIYMEHKKELVNAEGVVKRFGFGPEKLVDYFALLGDSVDNIPGVPGVGEKTAQKLVAQYGGIDEILAIAGRVAAQKPSGIITEKLGQALVKNTDRIRLNKRLLTLNTEVPVSLDQKGMAAAPPKPGIKEFLLRLGFVSLLKELGMDGAPLVSKQERQEKPSQSGAFHDLKLELRKNPSLAKSLKGAVLDIKLLAWLVNPSEESFEPDWLLARHGCADLDALAEALEKKAKEAGLWKLYEEMELPLTYILARMEETGVRINQAYLEDLRRRWSAELEEIRHEVIRVSGAQEDLNLNSPKQLAVLLFENLGLPKLKKTKTGYSTNEEVLMKLRSMHPVAAKLLEHRELSKLQSTYAEGLLACIHPSTGKVHATFHQEGTQTGRLSCTNPNLQNIPIRSQRGLEIRKAFEPDGKDWLLLSMDYSQIDLRVFAHLSADPQLIRFFEEGGDIHTETAKLLLDAGDGEPSAELRRAAKAVNFGILYGMGAHGLSQAIETTFEEAQRIIDLYYARFPQVARWREEQIREAREKGCVHTLFGRVRYLENINSPRMHLREFSERAAVNTPVQGTSADIIKRAMIDVARFIEERRLSLRMIIQVHDEILFEGPEKEIRGHAKDLENLMSEAADLRVPLVVHSKAGPNWRDLEPLNG